MIAKESPLKGKSKGNPITVAIRELPGVHSIDLRVAPGSSAQAAVEQALAVKLPAKTGQMLSKSGNNESYMLSLAPDWWLLVGFDEAEEKLNLLRLNNDHHFSIVDVSGQRTSIELEGPNVRDVLAHLWEQDLREKSFPVGSVSQGLMAKAPVIVVHVDTNRYRVM